MKSGTAGLFSKTCSEALRLCRALSDGEGSESAVKQTQAGSWSDLYQESLKNGCIWLLSVFIHQLNLQRLTWLRVINSIFANKLHTYCLLSRSLPYKEIIIQICETRQDLLVSCNSVVQQESLLCCRAVLK